MAEYIELEVAVKAFNNFDAGRADSPPCTLLTPEEFAEYLYELPTADVAPVVHGRWMKRRNGGTLCSRCGHYTQYKGRVLDMSEAIACPWCGAMMDGESTKGDVEHGMGSKE